MSEIISLLNDLNTTKYDESLVDIYGNNSIAYQKLRISNAIKQFEAKWRNRNISIFSAPGRSEICGNHTDHQHGEVLAASINLDAIAVCSQTYNNQVTILSEGYPAFAIDTDDLEINEDEYGTTAALVRGVLAGFKSRGYSICGFDAYITSDVLIGAGLSSSAAFEVLISTIINSFANNSRVSEIEIAFICQEAERNYFGKPCGLMDQMACSVGGLIHIDFENIENPKVEKIDFDLKSYGYKLCITDTKSSHANLTDEYAAIPNEMNKIANFFKKNYLREISITDVLQNINVLRELYGDRAVLRTIHFFEENSRVKDGVVALTNHDFESFLKAIRDSGNSSFKYLQNIYTNKDVTEQSMSIALALSDLILKDDGVSRVHGGGFAGTIQAFVPNNSVDSYKSKMEQIFGENSCNILSIRNTGGILLF